MTAVNFNAISFSVCQGYHVGRLLEDYDSVQRNFRFRPDEIFPRVKLSLLVSLICECAFLLDCRQREAGVADGGDSSATPREPSPDVKKSDSYFPFSRSDEWVITLGRSLLISKDHNFFSTNSCRTTTACPAKDSKQSDERAYLLLDVRDADEFAVEHIVTAESYPRTNLSRANYETPSLLKYASR